VPESDGTQLSDVLAHEELQTGFNPMFLQEGATLLGSNHRILKNIVNLLAYAQAAREKAKDMTAEHKGMSHTQAPILRLILELSRPSKDKNVVWRFLQVFKKVQKVFRIGIGSYLLKIVHHSIRDGKGIVEFKSIHEPPTVYDFISKNGSRAGQKAYMHVVLNAKRVGFTQGDPHYFQKLRVHVDDFRKKQNKLLPAVRNSFKAARKACLAEAEAMHYQAFQNKLDAVRTAKEDKAENRLKQGAFNKIIHTKVLTTKPNGGVNGAKATLKKVGRINVASNKQISATAKRLAKAWAHKHGRCGSLHGILNLAPRAKPKMLRAAPKAIKAQKVKTLKASQETKAKVARAKAVRKAARAAMKKAKAAHSKKKAKKAKALERKGKVMKADVLRKTLAKERRLKAQKRQKQAQEKKKKAQKLKEVAKKASKAKKAAAEQKKKHASKAKEVKAKAKAANAAAKRKALALKAKSCRQRVWNTNIWYFNTDCCSGCDGRAPAPGGMRGACTYRWKMGFARSRCQCKATPKGAITFRTSRYYFGTDCCAGCRSAGSRCVRRHKGAFATSTCTCSMSC